MQTQWHAMRGFSRDPSVVKTKLTPGTVRRIAGYARPYRLDLVYLPARRGPGRRRHGRVPAAAGRRHRPGNPAQADRHRALGGRRRSPGWRSSTRSSGVVQRYFTSRVGEGLIYDLRTQVFGHVQRQPIAFFTRAQTGSLVEPAQQRRDRGPAGAHVDAVVGRLERPAAGARDGRHVRAVLAGHGRLAGADPAVPVPGAPGRAPAAAADQGVDAAGRRARLDDDRAVQRGRRDAVQAVRPACRRAGPVLRPGRAGARHRRADRAVGQRAGDRR